MYKGSEEEYKLLKNETEVIRKSILQFIGYIISISGLAAAAANFISTPKEDKALIILGSICVGLVIATLLFDVIWYKFKSHNRYVGYTRLLTQEVGCVKFNDAILSMNDTDENSFLDEVTLRDNEDGECQNLFTWEYMMARLNTARFENTKLRILESVKKIRFKFRLSSDYSYAALSMNNRKEIEDRFFENIVRAIYVPQKDTKEKFKDGLHDGFWGLLDLYIPIRFSFFRERFRRVDRRYLSTGWIFPKKVVQVVFFPVLLLIIFFFWVLIRNFRFSINIFSDEFSVAATSLTILTLVIFFLWVFRYIGGLRSIIFGKYSTEYFSWAFFIFRVQLLNSYGIYPIYFSRNFVRYYKSMNILECLSMLQSEIQTGEVSCTLCGETREAYIDISTNNCGDSLAFSVEKVQENNQVTIDDFKKICVICRDQYINILTSGKRLPKENNLRVFHRAIKAYRKMKK